MNILEYVNALAEAGPRWALLGFAQRYEGRSYVTPAFDHEQDAVLRALDPLVLQVADRLARTGWSAAEPCMNAGNKGKQCHNTAVGDITNMIRSAAQMGLDEVLAGKPYEPPIEAVAGAWITTVSEAWRTWDGDHDAVRASVHRAAKNSMKVALPDYPLGSFPKQPTAEPTNVITDAPDDTSHAPTLAHHPATPLQVVGSLLLGLGGLVAVVLAAGKAAPTVKRNPGRRASWRDFIRGEWWLLDGEELYADQDIGEVGHETLAIDYMLDKDALVSGIQEHWQAKIDGEDEEAAALAEEKLQEFEGYDFESDEYTAGNIFALVSIPDEVGVACVAARSAISGASAEQIWEDIFHLGTREAFAKHYGAVMAHDRDFTAWKVDDEVLERIREFILGQAAEQGEAEPDDPDTEISIEEASTSRIAYTSVANFLTIRHPRDLWDPIVETKELWDSVTKDRDEQKS